MKLLKRFDGPVAGKRGLYHVNPFAKYGILKIRIAGATGSLSGNQSAMLARVEGKLSTL
jgi:hypothetical protein